MRNELQDQPESTEGPEVRQSTLGEDIAYALLYILLGTSVVLTAVNTYQHFAAQQLLHQMALGMVLQNDLQLKLMKPCQRDEYTEPFEREKRSPDIRTFPAKR